MGISVLLNPSFPGYKLFEELILDFGIPQTDRRKFNCLMRNIPSEWLENVCWYNLDIYDSLVTELKAANKVPKHAYRIINVSYPLDKRYEYWNSKITVPDHIIWEEVHKANFTCTIKTRLRSFYFKIVHNTIALNAFLYKIKRKDSPNCVFCDNQEESITHLFCDCEKVTRYGHIHNFNLTNFEKLFGFSSDRLITYLLLVAKYYIYICKFKGDFPSVDLLKSFYKEQKDIEYFSAKKESSLFRLLRNGDLTYDTHVGLTFIPVPPHSALCTAVQIMINMCTVYTKYPSSLFLL